MGYFPELIRSDVTNDVYDDLLSFGREIGEHFADLEPQDNIDIQSVIWVTEAYVDGREERQP